MNGWKRTFYIIWVGQLFSSLSSSIVGYAIVFWLSIHTGSAEVLAFAMIASLLPMILLSPFTGVLVDRLDRKKLMIFSDLFIAFCTGIIALMFYFDRIEIWQIYFLLALRSFGSSFHIPAMKASIPLLAPESQLLKIAGVNQIIQAMSSIVGPAVAAVLIVVLDMTYVMTFDILGAIIASVSLLFIKIPPTFRQTPNEQNFFEEMKEGLHAILSVRPLAWLFSFDVMVMFFLVPIAALFPLMTTEYFRGSTFDMSVVEIAWGVGSLLGGTLLSFKILRTMNKVRLIIAMCIIMGISIFLSGILTPNGFVLFVIFTAIGGIAAAIWNATFVVVLQTQVENMVLGRVFATYEALILLPSIPGLLATGLIAETIGLSFSFLLAGIAICCLGILLLFIPAVVKMGRMVITQK